MSKIVSSKGNASLHDNWVPGIISKLELNSNATDTSMTEHFKSSTDVFKFIGSLELVKYTSSAFA